MKELYLISGLGADKRVFDFLDLPGFKIHHIEWVEPGDHETVENYAKRLLNQIRTVKPILIGLSFGGLIAIEIGKLMETEKIILISSAKTRFDLPLYYRISGRLGLNKLLPVKRLKKVNDLTFWLFGTTQEAERNLLRTIIHDTDNTFLAWGINKMSTWKNKIRLENAILIQGTDDRILPNKKPDFKIIGGGHFMIVNKASEISKLLKHLLG